MNKKTIDDFISTANEIKNLMEKKSCINYDTKVVPKLQFFTLKYISENKGIIVGDLANVLMMSSGAVAQLIERLVYKGWIKKEVDEHDKRIFHLSLTNTGGKEVLKMDKIFVDKMISMLSNISEKDLMEIVRIQKKLLEQLRKNF